MTIAISLNEIGGWIASFFANYAVELGANSVIVSLVLIGK